MRTCIKQKCIFRHWKTLVISKLLENIFWAGWYKKEKVKIKVIVKIVEKYIRCLVSSYIYNIVWIYNQVLMASKKFNSKNQLSYI